MPSLTQENAVADAVTAPPSIEVERPGLGSATLRRLDWDCEFFGFECGVLSGVSVTDASGRKQAFEALLREVIEAARKAGYAHFVFRPAVDDWDAVHACEGAGLLLIDLGVDFITDLKQPPAAIPAFVRRARDEDLPALRDLAANAFVYSRFGVDPAFTPAQVEAFHRQWVTNLHNGLAQAVLVSEAEGEVTGFVSCSLSGDQGRIPLIATKAGHRGQGLGATLVASARRWFHDNGATVARVKTQATNVPAVRLYERNGFVLERTELTFSIDLRRGVQGGK
jgi:dTDP-4-amino-4,6-dideoxy-D-galactose acyltransferase